MFLSRECSKFMLQIKDNAHVLIILRLLNLEAMSLTRGPNNNCVTLNYLTYTAVMTLERTLNRELEVKPVWNRYRQASSVTLKEPLYQTKHEMHWS